MPPCSTNAERSSLPIPFRSGKRTLSSRQRPSLQRGVRLGCARGSSPHSPATEPSGQRVRAAPLRYPWRCVTGTLRPNPESTPESFADSEPARDEQAEKKSTDDTSDQVLAACEIGDCAEPEGENDEEPGLTDLPQTQIFLAGGDSGRAPEQRAVRACGAHPLRVFWSSTLRQPPMTTSAIPLRPPTTGRR